MKMHLMIITAMLSLCIADSGKAQDATDKKATGAACASADECQSNVCTDQICAEAPPAKKDIGAACASADECQSNVCTDQKCAEQAQAQAQQPAIQGAPPVRTKKQLSEGCEVDVECESGCCIDRDSGTRRGAVCNASKECRTINATVKKPSS